MTLNEAAEEWLLNGGSVVVNRYDPEDFQLASGDQDQVGLYRNILFSPTDSLRFLSALISLH